MRLVQALEQILFTTHLWALGMQESHQGTLILWFGIRHRMKQMELICGGLP